MKLVWFVVSAILFLAVILLNKVYRSLSAAELRRRARGGHDKNAAALYKAAAYGESLELLLWLVGSLSAAALIIMAVNFGWWLAALIILAAGFFIFISWPFQPSNGWQWRSAALVAPFAAKLLSWLQPVLARLGSVLKDHRPPHRHSGLYEKEDLLELLKIQNKQLDNRFSEAELAIVYGALTFGDRSVGQLMTPRAKLRMVTPGDAIGPHLLDELHASGQAAFLVVKEISRSAALDVAGVIYLSDLVDHVAAGGKVRELMRAKVHYANETQTLREALAAFIKTHAHLLVVVNSFEEVVGALTIEQIAEQILGYKITSEFDRYDDLSSVAGLQK